MRTSGGRWFCVGVLAGALTLGACRREPNYAVQLVYAPANGVSVDAGSLEEAAGVIRRRLDALDVGSSRVETVDSEIRVKLVRAPAGFRSSDLIAPGTRLELVPGVAADMPGSPPEGVEARQDLNGPKPHVYWRADSPTQLEAAIAEMTDVAVGEDGTGGYRTWRMARSAALVSPGLLDAIPGSDELGQPMVTLVFTPEASEAFAALTAALAQKRAQLLVILDGKVMTAPTVHDAITGGRAVITLGPRASPEDAKTLAGALELGSLPIPLQLVRESTVPPR